MTFPILGGNGAVAGYSIDNSLRFNDGDSPNLSRTPSGSPTNNKKFTLSFWLKRSNLSASSKVIFHAYDGSSDNRFSIRFQSDDKLYFDTGGTSGKGNTSTNQVFRDTSAFYHIVTVLDTTEATGSDRMKVYVNGSQVDITFSSTPSLNSTACIWNLAQRNDISSEAGSSNFFDGYLSEVHNIDGQALSPTDFGEFDEDSGIWKPIQYTGTYGTNGFYLDFENSGSLGADQSGNGNNFTPTNLASTDQTTDTPTNNFATLSSIDKHTTSPTLAEGNLDFTGVGGTAFTPARSTMAVSSGKWYMEYKFKTAGGGVGIMTTQSPINDHLRDDSDVRSLYRGWNGYYYGRNNSGAIDDVGDNSQTFSADDIGMIALDLDNGYVYFGKNGTWLYGQDGTTTGVPTSGSSGTGSANHPTQLLTNQHDGVWGFMAYDISTATSGNVIANFGNIPSTISSPNSDANGYGKFYYAPPSGYLALCTQNLATALSPTIDDGSAYFHTQLYTGDGQSSKVITNDANAGDFQPDWVWIKERSSTSAHLLFDSTRGTDKRLRTNGTNAEETFAYLSSFDTDGFTIGTSDAAINENTQTYVAWQWLANGGTTSSNTDGDVTSTVQVNSTAGFSITTFTGNSSPPLAVGHGLGVAPKVVLAKHRNVATHWRMWHQGLSGAGYYVILDLTNAQANGEPIFSGLPTSTTVGFLSDFANTSHDIVFYSFAEIEGYSKFGSYTGNGSTDGTFVYTGFRPAFILRKRTDTTGAWLIQDNKRTGFNRALANSLPSNNDVLRANDSTAEEFNNELDILSNGFKLRATDTFGNASGGTYIYTAFAENPFVSSSGVPVVAR